MSTVSTMPSTEISAAGDPSSSHIRGIWLRNDHVATLNVTGLKNANITDVFVLTRRVGTAFSWPTVLNSTIAKLNGTGIRIHAWITCFRIAQSNWIDPQGRYSYQVQVPYTVPMRVRVRTRHRTRFWNRGRWRVRWAYRWTYRTEHQKRYRQETRYGYNDTHINNLISFISNVTREYSGRIHGIHLDYVRYSGAGNNAAYRHNGTEVITRFVRNVRNTVKAIDNSIELSAALMPERAGNARYYGECYYRLSRYLDFLVPMVYKGNYNQNTLWIEETTRWIVERSNGTRVITGLQTYVSDGNLTLLPADELRRDIKAAIRGGSSGFVLFRYGLINRTFFSFPVNPSNSPPTAPSGPRWYQQYLHLRETRNAQVNDPAIRSLAASLISGATSTYNIATRIFNWVRDNISYSFYFNTRRGAVRTLKDRTGNCVDQSHLLVALSRAAGIPARYMHGNCTFIPSGNTFGHVWPQMWVNGRWHDADTTSSRNSFGVINNWNTTTVVMIGTHSSIPF